jgi:hypothetical protein
MCNFVRCVANYFHFICVCACAGMGVCVCVCVCVFRDKNNYKQITDKTEDESNDGHNSYRFVQFATNKQYE